MWLGQAKSRVRFQHAPSFKDIHILLSDDEGDGDTLGSPRKLTVCHRSRRSVRSLLRTLSQPLVRGNGAAAREVPDSEIEIPGAEKSIVVYYTSLRVVRSTFEDCNAVRSILRAFRVPIDERDLSMDSGFTEELRRILGLSEKSKLTLPRVFIGGRYIGGAEEVKLLHESGELKKYMERLPVAEPGTCESCGGYRFILCVECSGSHKYYSEKAGFRSCTSCNENGLIRAMRIFNTEIGKNGKKQPTWEVVKAPLQPDSKQCGFFVLRYMRQLLDGDVTANMDSLRSIFEHLKCTRADIDEVRVEWAECIQDHIKG